MIKLYLSVKPCSLGGTHTNKGTQTYTKYKTEKIKISTQYNTYMSLACWEVRIVINCNRGLENAVREGQHLQAWDHSFSYAPTSTGQYHVYFFLRLIGLQMVLFKKFVIDLRAVYKPFVKNLCIERVTQILDKQRCIILTNRFISNYFMLVAFSSPVKFP